MNKIINWTEQIDKITNQMLSTFGELTIDQLNWKPNSNTWSIAQNLEHLIVLNQTYFPIFKSLKEGNYNTPFIAKFGFITTFLGNTILKSVQPDRKRKMRTFPIWEPNSSNIVDNILESFENHQNELKQEILEIEKYIGNGIVIISPANKNIVYKLETALDIIVSHELRHYYQAIEVFNLLKSNKTI